MTVQEKLRKHLPELDFGVQAHGFKPYMRDYIVVVQIGGNSEAAGTHECLFTHCVVANVETRVRDDVWPQSWNDEFINYEAWRAAGEPSGYVWGAEWTLAYPGLTYVASSALAAEWAARLGKSMHELTLETDAYLLRLVFHDVRFRQLNNETSPVNSVLIPLAPQ
jgi:hypothetical protein